MKKAQTITQVFVFIIAIVVFALIVVYGIRAVNNFLAQQEKIALVEFKTDLEGAVEKIKKSYGTVEKIELTLPSKYKGLCILDPVMVDENAANPFMLSAWKTKTENVFFDKPVAKTGIWLEDITIKTQQNQGFVCVTATNNKINLRFEGTGTKVKISEWQD